MSPKNFTDFIIFWRLSKLRKNIIEAIYSNVKGASNDFLEPLIFGR